MQSNNSINRVCEPGIIARSTRSLRGVASTAALTVATTVAMSGGAWAQCTNPGINNLVAFGSGAAISSIISTVGTINNASLGQSTAFVGTPAGAKPDEQGGGHWSRVVAGTVETSSTTSTSVNFLGIPLGQADCNTVTKQEYVGTQAGMDISRLNFAGGGNIHWGTTAGYFDVKSKDRTPGQGSFSSNTQVAFAGLYMAVNSGGFNFDAQLRGDFYHSELSDVNEALFKQSLDAKGVAFLWNASYTFNLAKNWFMRPSIGGSWSNTDIDPLTSAGAVNVTDPPTASITEAGVVQIAPVQSLVGRASITVGGTVTTGNLALQPFATASVFHEFAGDVKTRMSSDVFGFQLDGQSSTTRVGTYAHFGIGIAGTIVNTGWLGYIKGDYLTGDKIDAMSINAGLRYQFQPSGGDGSMKDGSGHHGYAGRNWSGLYLGYYTGGIHGVGEWSDQQGLTQPKFSGYNLGGAIGYNFQIGHLVLGLEGEYGLTNAKGGRDCPFPDGLVFSCEADMNSLGMLTGRIGFAKERALYYVKGGVAVGQVDARVQPNIPPGLELLAFPLTGGQQDSKTMVGWALGGGVEFAITDRWSVKGEYMHFDLGKATFQTFDNGPGAVFPANVHVKGDTVRIGVNYHFGHRDTHHEPMK